MIKKGYVEKIPKDKVKQDENLPHHAFFKSRKRFV